MKFLRWFAKSWRAHGTKILGYLAAAVPALIAIEGLIPKGHMKWWLAAGTLLGLAVVHRGHQNTKRISQEPANDTP